VNYEILKPKTNPTGFEIKPLYGLDPEEARAMAARVRWELFDAEYYTYLFKTKNVDMVSRFIPPPLKFVAEMPLINVCVQQLKLNDGEGNDGLNAGYLENILGAVVEYKGSIGLYPISILIETDIGAIAGREMIGTAKKVGQFEYGREGNRFSWKTSRRGIPIIEASGEVMPGEADPSGVTSLLEQPTYHLHQVMGPLLGNEGPLYAYKPRLMKLWAQVDKIHSFQVMDNVSFGFNESPFDPICLMEPSEILGASYLKANTSIRIDPEFEELDADEMTPFLFSKFDPL